MKNRVIYFVQNGHRKKDFILLLRRVMAMSVKINLVKMMFRIEKQRGKSAGNMEKVTNLTWDVKIICILVLRNFI